MSSLTKTFLLLCVMMFLSTNNATHVKILNTLDNNLEFTVHCKSKDDDLG